ncbi:MAG: hypothetical protein IKG22_00315 [Atopobiaceae bacterium]|nr:hypothetical protein [Atopobiaceae bacterium]
MDSESPILQGRVAGGRRAGSIGHVAVWVLVLAITLGVSCLTPKPALAATSVSAKVSGSVDYRASYECLTKMNKLRQSKGLKTLKMDKALLKAAEQRAAEISVAFAHVRPNGSSPATVSGYLRGEVIAKVMSGSNAYELWKGSPDHYANMVNSSFRTCGICCFERSDLSNTDEGRTKWWVAVFGTSRSGSVKKSTAIKRKTSRVQIAKKYLTKKSISMYSGWMSEWVNEQAVVYFNPSFGFSSGILPNSLFNFKSSKKSVLTVNKSGVLTPKGRGKSRITATLKGKKSCNTSATMKVDSGHFGEVHRFD